MAGARLNNKTITYGKYINPFMIGTIMSWVLLERPFLLPITLPTKNIIISSRLGCIHQQTFDPVSNLHRTMHESDLKYIYTTTHSSNRTQHTVDHSIVLKTVFPLLVIITVQSSAVISSPDYFPFTIYLRNPPFAVWRPCRSNKPNPPLYFSALLTSII